MPGIHSFGKIGQLDVELYQRYSGEVAPARETSCLPLVGNFSIIILSKKIEITKENE